jgi:hypothetical protein
MKGHLARRLGVLTLAVVLAITVGGSAAAHPDSGAAPKAGFTLTVGTTLSLTGDGAVFGPAFQKSAQLAVDLANEAGMTLIGFLRGASMNVYSGTQRVVQ